MRTGEHYLRADIFQRVTQVCMSIAVKANLFVDFFAIILTVSLKKGVFTTSVLV